jgi:hypothetical protein
MADGMHQNLRSDNLSIEGKTGYKSYQAPRGNTGMYEPY